MNELTPIATAALLLGAALVFLCAVAVMALGAWGWANAIAAAHRARAHGYSADEQERTVSEAREALDTIAVTPSRARYEQPPDEDLVDAILAERAAAAASRQEPSAESLEYTTTSNENYTDNVNLEGGFYAR